MTPDYTSNDLFLTIKIKTMVQKVWKERHIYFNIGAKVIIAPNET